METSMTERKRVETGGQPTLVGEIIRKAVRDGQLLTPKAINL